MARNRSVSPPPAMCDDGKQIWRAAVRQLQQQGTWRAVDGPLLESYVESVLCGRAMRAAGQHGPAAEAERDAADRANALMLTPIARRHAPAVAPSRRRENGTGTIETSSSVYGVEAGGSLA